MADACLHHKIYESTYLKCNTTRVWLVFVPTLHRGDGMVQNLGAELANGWLVNAA